MPIAIILMFIGLLGAFSSARVLAADHSNLEEGLPVEVEDAYAIPLWGREVQGLARYERTQEGEDRVRLEPRIEVGLLPNLQAKVLAPFIVGSADRTGSGDVGAGVLYNFSTEGLHLPAFAISAEGLFPTGIDSRGVELTAKAIVTKSLGGKFLLHRLHINAAWTQDTSASEDERAGRYAAVLGYALRIGPDTMLIADVLRRQERKDGEESNIAEFGIRRQVTPLLVLALGAGVGFLDESPAFRTTAAFQYSLPL